MTYLSSYLLGGGMCLLILWTMINRGYELKAKAHSDCDVDREEAEAFQQLGLQGFLPTPIFMKTCAVFGVLMLAGSLGMTVADYDAPQTLATKWYNHHEVGYVEVQTTLRGYQNAARHYCNTQDGVVQPAGPDVRDLFNGDDVVKLIYANNMAGSLCYTCQLSVSQGGLVCQSGVLSLSPLSPSPTADVSTETPATE